MTTNTVGSVWLTTDLSAKKETSTMPRIANTIPKLLTSTGCLHFFPTSHSVYVVPTFYGPRYDYFPFPLFVPDLCKQDLAGQRSVSTVLSLHGTSQKLVHNHCYYGLHNLSYLPNLPTHTTSCTVARGSIPRCTYKRRIFSPFDI